MKKTLSSVNANSTKIKEIKFKIFSTDQINRLSVLKLTKKEMYDSSTKLPMPNGVLDTRLGISNKTGICQTCNQSIKDCAGHFGSYELILPVFHIGFFKHTCHILQCICKNCGSILLSPIKKHFYSQKVVSAKNNIIFYKNILKKIMEECKKFHKCSICDYINGNIKKGTGFKLYHEKNVIFNDLGENKDFLLNKITEQKYNSIKTSNPLYNNKIIKNERNTKKDAKFSSNLNILQNKKEKIKEELNPQTVLNLFKKIPLQDIELLGLSFPPQDLLIQNILVPPACIRPSVATETENGSNEDDLTVKLSEIIHTNQVLIKGLQKGNQLSVINEDWDFLQLQVSLLINSDLPGISNNLQAKPIRGLLQRLKGKHGRFRGNLSGKRVDFTGRTVISPDPNLSIEEVGIPIQMAKTLTVPETVTKYNLQYLKSLIKNGPHIHPGANYLYNKSTEFKRFLQYGDRNKIAENIYPGDIVERHIADGDIVLFNRQPSLHRLSIMAHQVKVMPHKTLRFNECVCTPYNADFDGDEMNIHVPQTLEARTEAYTLMRVRENIVTPRNGEPLVAATQDFITASYLLTSKDRFFTKQRFGQLICYFLGTSNTEDPYEDRSIDSVAKDTNPSTNTQSHPNTPDNPSTKTHPHTFFTKKFSIHPTILRPVLLYTGKQVIQILIQDSLINISSHINIYSKNRDCIKDDYTFNTENECIVIFKSNFYLYGRIDKSIIGSENKKNSILYKLMCINKICSVRAMNSLSRLCSRYISEIGFSIGIDDVYPSVLLQRRKNEIIKKGYEECKKRIEMYMGSVGVEGVNNHIDEQQGVSNRDSILGGVGNSKDIQKPTNNLSNIDASTLESDISGILSKIREQCGNICIKELNKSNTPLIMQACGSKGSKINVSQMISCVGQQIISGKRIPDGFYKRSLPHYTLNSKIPQSKGFVSSSFFSGMTPQEFFFHAVSGREGLVDTAVKTAETGYMQRRLMKALEDLSVQYDYSVRNSNNEVVQFLYGDDVVDPCLVEDERTVVDLEKIYREVKEEIVLELGGVSNRGIQSEGVSKRGIESEGVSNKVSSLRGVNDKDCKHGGVSNSYSNYKGVSNKDSKQEGVIYSNNIKLPLNNLSSNQHFFNNNPFLLDKIQTFLKEKQEDTIFIRGKHIILVNSNKNMCINPNPITNPNTCINSNSNPNSNPICTNIPFTDIFIDKVLARYSNCIIQPGTAVGALAGQSIGEPGTQMTLKTFHFAGVASMNITLGVPRLKEIINATVNISTPIINTKIGVLGLKGEGSSLLGVSNAANKQQGVSTEDKTIGTNPHNNTYITNQYINPEYFARGVKGRLERVCLKDVCDYIKEIYGKYEVCIEIGINTNTIKLLCLDIDMLSIKNRICEELKVGKEYVYIKGGVIIMNIRRGVSKRYVSNKGSKLHPLNISTTEQHPFNNSTNDLHPFINISTKQSPNNSTSDSEYYFMKDIKRSVRNVVICGLKSVGRVVLHKGEDECYNLLVEGSGLLGVLGTVGVDCKKTMSNNIMEIQGVLGIEGARQSIINEVEYTMGKHGMKIDCRHVMLLADTMTYRGEVLGITRFGISKMKCSTLMLASFEQTGDHLFEAALYGIRDSVLGVSESIIMGRGISIGTGATELYYEDRGC